jgi:hypothetical protein
MASEVPSDRSAISPEYIQIVTRAVRQAICDHFSNSLVDQKTKRILKDDMFDRILHDEGKIKAKMPDEDRFAQIILKLDIESLNTHNCDYQYI